MTAGDTKSNAQAFKTCFISAPFGADLSGLINVLDEANIQWEWAKSGLAYADRVAGDLRKLIRAADLVIAVLFGNLQRSTSFFLIAVTLRVFLFCRTICFLKCKNWSAAVDSVTVDSFVTKIRAARLDLGILIAANGITGDLAQRTAANDIIRRAFDRDNIRVSVVTRVEIQSFRCVADAIALMRNKFGGLIMRMASV